MTTILTAEAREALRLAEADPGQSAALAAEVAAQAKAAHDLAAAAIAERALGLAALHIDSADAAMRHLRTAITLGRRAGSPGLAAEARMTLAYVLNGRGRSRQALREINAAVLDLDGIERARAEAQRGAILEFHGRAEEALASFRRALPTLRRAGDYVWVQRVLSNRAVLYGYRNEFTAAMRDLREAEELCGRHGLGLSAGFVQQNLGWVETLRGDVPAALMHLDLAEQRFRALGSRLGFILADRTELLLSLRLFSEARQTGEHAVRQIEREGQQIALPEARLILARVAALDGDSAYAASQARHAVREFARQQRPVWTALARFELLSSRLSEDGPLRVTTRQFEQAADALLATGRTVTAAQARLLAGQLALARGRKSEACRLLAPVSPGRRRGPALLRGRAWYAEALIRLANGNERGAVSAARSGLRVLDEYRATLAATDLRAYAAGHRSDLAGLGLRITISSGNARRVLAWAEEGRARHLLSRPARPPEDPELAAAMGRLRVTMAKIEELRRAGRPSGDLVGRLAALERQIRDHYRRQPRSGAADPTPAVSVADLAAALGEAAFVEFTQLDGELHAVTVVDGRARLQHLGALDPLRNLVDHTASALRRLARHQISEASRAAAVTMLRYTAGQLDTALLDPLAGQVDGRPLVVIPTGPLQSLPWSLLPSCLGRPVTVAPSAALWYSAHCRKSPQRRQVTVAAGPGLPGARDEADAVAAIYRTTALHGTSATVKAVTAALHRADLVHLAAHGRVRADNPLFSSLTLADGPLTVFDLERLDRVAPMVVLAACDSGRPVVCTGDELLGFGATLLSLGTHQLIASVVPVPDVETAPLMIAFHRQLAAGHDAADALSQAQRQLADGEDRAMAAAAGFICIGDGMKANANRSDLDPLPGRTPMRVSWAVRASQANAFRMIERLKSGRSTARSRASSSRRLLSQSTRSSSLCSLSLSANFKRS
jgi:CHAT domain-containing protein